MNRISSRQQPRPSLPVATWTIGGFLLAFSFGSTAHSQNIHYERLVAHSHYTHGLPLHTSKRYQDALEAFSEATKIDPSHAWAWHFRGNNLLLLGKSKDAISAFKKAVTLDNSLIYSHYNLACLYSLASNSNEAIAYLGKALAKGYTKLAHLSRDSDLNNIRSDPRFGSLVAKFSKQRQLSPSQEFQNLGHSDRFAFLEGLMSESKRIKQAELFKIALLAIHDRAHEVRVLGMGLFAKMNSKKARQRLVTGLYDSNGYVAKAAANHLVNLGKNVENLVLPIVKGRRSIAVQYAIQILGLVGAKGAAKSMVKHLNAPDATTRIAAIDSLGRLGAVFALPQLKAALKKETTATSDFKETAVAHLKKTIAHLASLKSKGQH